MQQLPTSARYHALVDQCLRHCHAPTVNCHILEGVSRWLARCALYIHRESAKVSIGYLPSTYLYLVTLNKPPYYFTILHMYTDL